MARRTCSPSWSVSTAKLTTPGDAIDAAAPTVVCVIQQQHLLEADVADLGVLAKNRAAAASAISQ